jgi:hypothetical protein
METASHSENRHPSDADLVEGILAREGPDPHVAGCPECAARRERIGRVLDPSAADPLLDAADPFFDVRQAAKIRARLAARSGWRQRLLASFGIAHPLRTFAAVSAAVLIVLFAGIGGWRRPEVEPIGPAAVSVSTAVSISEWSPTTEQDRVDDAMLDEIDSMISEDPYALGGIFGG